MTTAASALEHVLISRFGTLGRVNHEFLLRSDNGLVFASRHYTALVRNYGLKQEFITPHRPQQNGMVERVIRTLKEQCVHRHRFESIQHAAHVIGDWIRFYNNRRPRHRPDPDRPVQSLGKGRQVQGCCDHHPPEPPAEAGKPVRLHRP